MAPVFSDASFSRNLAYLLIAAVLLFSVELASRSPVGSRNLTNAEMVSIEGRGWSTGLLVVGVLVLGIGLAAICTGGTIAIAAAFVVQPALVSAGLSAVSVGTSLATVGAGSAGLGVWLGSR